MARKKIQGITIEIGGDTTKLQDKLRGVENQIRDAEAALKDISKLLKLDPGNTELLTQKQKYLNDEYDACKEKLKVLQEASEEAYGAMVAGADGGKEQFDAVQREIIETEQKMKDLKDQMKEFGSVTAQQMAAAGDKVKTVGDKMAAVGTALTKYVTGPIVALGAAATAAFTEVDDGLDIIAKKTGATGDELAEMEDAAKNLATSIPTDFRTAGEAVGEVSTRFDLTGQALEDLAGKFIKFADLNDTDVTSSIDSVQAAMAAFGVGADQAKYVLDMLNKASQDTGADINKLTGDLTANAAALQEMGLNINTAIGFLASLDKSGADSSAVLSGLKKALQNATKDGKSMDAALADLTKKIKGAKSETKAMQIATDLFGAKSAPAMVKAIRDGRISFEQLANQVKDWNGSVEQTFENTLDPIDQFKTTLNELKIVGADLVNAAAPMIKSVAEGLKNAVSGIRAAWEGLSPQMQETIIKLAGVAAAIGPVLTIGGKLVSGIGSLMGLAPKLASAFGAVKTALSAVWAVMAANPIGLIIAAVAGIATALVVLYNKCEWFRNAVNSIGEAIKNIFTSGVEWFKNAVNDIGNFLGNLKDSALQWGRDMIQNFINGIKQMLENAKNTLKNFAQMIKDFLGFSEPKTGPLSDFSTYSPDMVDLFVKGLKDNQQKVADQLSRTFALPEAAASAGGAATQGAEASTFTTPLNDSAKTVNMTFVVDGARRWAYEAVLAENMRVGIDLSGGGL